MLWKRYRNAFFMGMGSGVVGTTLGIVSLWVTTTLVDKESFGEFSISLTLVMILSSIIAAGPEGVVLYRCTRKETPPHMSSAYGCCSLWFSFIFGMIVALTMILLANPIARAFGKPGLAVWLEIMGIILALDPPRLVLAAWNQANERSGRATFLRASLPYLSRTLALFILILAIGAGSVQNDALIALAYVFSVIVALGVSVVLSSDLPYFFRWNYTNFDIKYCSKLIASAIVGRPRRTIDVVLMGALGSASATAEYMVASRLAQLPTMVKQAVELLLVPRFGFLISRQQHNELNKEYKIAQAVMFVAGLGGLLVFAFVGEYILSWFGQSGYEEAFGVLLILGAATVVRSAFGSVGNLANIAGYAGWRFWATLSGAVVLVGVAFVTIPLLGAIGGGIATVMSALVTNVFITIIVRSKVGMRVLDVTNAGVLSLAVCSAVLGGFGLISGQIVGGVMVVCAGVVSWRHRADVMQLYALVRARTSRA